MTLVITNAHPGSYKAAGMFFGFEQSTADAFFQDDRWSGKQFSITTSGGRTGDIIVWKNDVSCGNMNCGRWDKGLNKTEWPKANDWTTQITLTRHVTSGWCKKGGLSYVYWYGSIWQGNVECDTDGIPYYKARYNSNYMNITYVKPYEVKNPKIINCDYNVGGESFKAAVQAEEAKKDKMCSTLIWNMEQKNAITKKIFNKWYLSTSNGNIDYSDYKMIYSTIIKLCSVKGYIYSCKTTSPNTQCAGTLCNKGYANGGVEHSDNQAKMDQISNCPSKNGKFKTSYGTVAYVASGTTINFCPIWMKADKRVKAIGLDSRLGTVFHEFSHLGFVGAFHDVTYGADQMLKTDKTAARDAAMDKNAATFDNFVEDMYENSGYKTWDEVRALTQTVLTPTSGGGTSTSGGGTSTSGGGTPKTGAGTSSSGFADLILFVLIILLILRL